ncbi:hypothetical protein AB7W14_03890 [Providencia rettgeri]
MNQIGMPLIYANNKVVNPCVNGQPIKSKCLVFSEKTCVTTIGSGLIIGKDIIDIISRKYQNTFDDRFLLYGVDTTFCYRLQECHLYKHIVICSGFEHSLSRLEKEESTIKHFRRKERSIDIGLRIKFYYKKTTWPKHILLLLLSNLKKRILRKKQEYYFIKILKTIIKGKHERL